MTKDEVLSYLSLSRYNPKFVADFEYVIHQLDLLQRRGEITSEEYLEIYNSFFKKKGSSGNERIYKSFEWFLDIVENGFFNFQFNDDKLRILIVTREVSGKFFSWVDGKRHDTNNPYIIQYLNELAMELIDLWKGGDERKWDVYHELKGSAVRALSRGIVSRSRISAAAKVIVYVMNEELKIIKDHPKKRLEKMSIFTDEYDPNIMDLDSIVVEMTSAFLLDPENFVKLQGHYFKELDRLVREGTISNEQFPAYLSMLRKGSYDLVETKKTLPYMPIIEYYYAMNKNPEKSPAIVFNMRQINEAWNLSKDFFKTLGNEFLINELVLKKFSVDLEVFNYDLETRNQFYKILKDNLNLLRKFGIITYDQYDEYLEKGRVKFL